VQKYENGANRVSASRLQHLCQILQVPVAFFFEGLPVGASPEVAEGSVSPPYINDFLSTSDGLALARAFMGIRDLKLRRAIVALVEQITAGLDSAAA